MSLISFTQILPVCQCVVAHELLHSRNVWRFLLVKKHSIARGEPPIVTRRCNTFVFLVVQERDLPSAPPGKTKTIQSQLVKNRFIGNSSFRKSPQSITQFVLPESTMTIVLRYMQRGLLPNMNVVVSENEVYAGRFSREGR
jgi:hypothetical protein